MKFIAATLRFIRSIRIDKTILHEVKALPYSLQCCIDRQKRLSIRIDIQGLGFPLTAALVDHTERRLRFALTRTSNRIKRVVVRLGDRNGPRGGDDKFCKIQVLLEHAQPVLIEDTGADLYAVIDRAAERAGRNVAKNLGRLRENVRLAMPRPPALPPDDAFDVTKK